jgi:hypothetical protein
MQRVEAAIEPAAIVRSRGRQKAAGSLARTSSIRHVEVKHAAEVVREADKVFRIGVEVLVTNRGDVAERNAVAEHESVASVLCNCGPTDAKGSAQEQAGNNTKDFHCPSLPMICFKSRGYSSYHEIRQATLRAGQGRRNWHH